MSVLHLMLIALVQGITEFLPISSSGHLILLPYLTGLEDQGQVIDVAVHVGTLGAVVLYFWPDVRRAFFGTLQLATFRTATEDARLALNLAIATVPVVIVGLILSVTGAEDAMRSVKVVAWATIFFGIVLWWSDRSGSTTRIAEDWTMRHALVMGLWQVIALIPGTSRSGITITGARFLGYERSDAARLSMLMSIPTILASGVLLGAEVAADMNTAAARDGAIAAAFAFVAALGALHVMMRLLRSVSFTPYVIYRLAMGAVLLAIAYA